MLEVKNVSKQYRGEDKLLFDAVSDVSLSMADHRIYALVGESGCGKSTLSRLILKEKTTGKKQRKQFSLFYRMEKARLIRILRFIR